MYIFSLCPYFVFAFQMFYLGWFYLYLTCISKNFLQPAVAKALIFYYCANSLFTFVHERCVHQVDWPLPYSLKMSVPFVWLTQLLAGSQLLFSFLWRTLSLFTHTGRDLGVCMCVYICDFLLASWNSLFFWVIAFIMICLSGGLFLLFLLEIH